MTRNPHLVLTLLIATLASSCATAADKPAAPPTAAAHKDVGADEFEKLAKEPDTVVLDVRTPEEYSAGHLKNSVPIDFKDKAFAEKVAKLDKGKTYLVYCAVGGRSAKACGKLDQLDFPKVYNLTGGIKAWEKAGKPVEK
jgi:rhodanese-related sulfurtransferase